MMIIFRLIFTSSVFDEAPQQQQKDGWRQLDLLQNILFFNSNAIFASAVMSYSASAGNWVTLWLFGWEGVCAGTEKGGGCSLMLSGGAEVDWSRFGVMRLIQVTGSDRRNWGQREWGGLGRRTAGVHAPLTPRLFSFASLFCSPHPHLDLTFFPLVKQQILNAMTEKCYLMDEEAKQLRGRLGRHKINQRF